MWFSWCGIGQNPNSSMNSLTDGLVLVSFCTVRWHFRVTHPLCCNLEGVIQQNTMFPFRTQRSALTEEAAGNFLGESSLCVTGFLAETAGLLVIKGRASKIELSWFCCHTFCLKLVGPPDFAVQCRAVPCIAWPSVARYLTTVARYLTTMTRSLTTMARYWLPWHATWLACLT